MAPREVTHSLASLLGAFVAAVLVVAAATRWLPSGEAGIDHIVVPIVGFPLVWIGFALPLYAARNRRRTWLIAGAVSLLQLVVIVVPMLAR